MSIPSSSDRRFAFIAVLASVLVAACSDNSSGSNAASTDPSGVTGRNDRTSAQGPSDDTPNPSAPGRRLLAADALALPVARKFDLSHIEARHFAAALGKDPNRIFEFVRDRIAYEPYRGYLRGPRGTLLAMAGNSVDRAALLFDMLKSSGQQVRYARGTLPDSVAQDLVASLWTERAVPAESEQPAIEAGPEVERLVAAIKIDGTQLAESLARAGYPDDGAPGLSKATLIDEAREHYWVEMLQNGAWTAMDPSFAIAEPGQTIAEAESTVEALPEDLFHRIDMHIRVEERSLDGPGETREVLTYSANSADLSAVDVLLSHETAESESGLQVRPVLLVGQEQVIGLSFWLKAPQGSPGGGLADALGGGGGGDESMPTASAMSVEFEFISPGGQRESVVREIFDRLGKASRSGQPAATPSAASATPIATENLAGALYDFFVTTGAVRPEHLSGVAAEAPGPEGEEEDADVAGDLRMIAVTFAAVSDGLVGRAAAAGGRIVRAYQDTPRVIVTEVSAWDGSPRLAIDLRRDQPRVAVAGFDRQHLFFAQALRGVVEGELERQIMSFFVSDDRSDSAPGAQDTMSTSLVFERARAAGIQPVVLAGSGKPSAPDLPGDTRARVDEVLAAGELVVAPSGPVDVGGQKRFAWWQVDPRSGVTKAVTDEGLYQGTAEGVVVRANNGTWIVRLRHGGKLYRYTTKSADLASSYVRTATSRLANSEVTVVWDGLVELWEAALL